MSDDENAYQSLADAAGGEDRWAFGTGFTDPLAGVDLAVPAGVDAHDLALTCLVLADDALVLAQRLTGWLTRAPELEEEVAVANVALDLLGQARLLYARAGHADPSLRPAAAPSQVPDEDALAYFRGAEEFRNVQLMEIDDGGDFAVAMVRLLVASVWRLAVLGSVRDGTDPVLAAIAAKAVPELSYHRDYAAGWVARLGDGTDYSHGRAQAAVDAIWAHLPELAEAAPAVRAEVAATLEHVLAAATLRPPALGPVLGRGRGAEHVALDELLAELQSVARAHPAGTW